MPEARRARIAQLLEAARTLQDPDAPFASNVRSALCETTGLSPEGVSQALALCLEVSPSEADIDKLLASVASSSKAHVLLSANVFVAAHRAILLGLAAAPEVYVRSSRREPSMARLLWQQAPGLFHLVEELTPEPGDQLFAYGSASTLEQVAAGLPDTVRFHGHGPGFGLAVVRDDDAPKAAAFGDLAQRVALDLVLFDQRGCLSLRVLLFEGPAESAFGLSQAIAGELAAWERRVPRGRLSRAEAADITRFRDTFAISGWALPAGSGWVCMAPEVSREMLAPVGRNLLVIPVTNAIERARRIATHVTTFAVRGSAAYAASLRAVLPDARPAEFGHLQRPPLDGPVDLRPARPWRSTEVDAVPRSDREPRR